jgi:hypothetical protein
VVINDLNAFRAFFGPDEADTPLIVDANAMLTLTIALQGFQAIARWRTKKFQCRRTVELLKFPLCDGQDVSESGNPPSLEEGLGIGALESKDHEVIILRLTFNVKR